MSIPPQPPVGAMAVELTARQAIADACADIAPDNLATRANIQAAIDQMRIYLGTATANVTLSLTVNMVKTLIKLQLYIVRKTLLQNF